MKKTNLPEKITDSDVGSKSNRNAMMNCERIGIATDFNTLDSVCCRKREIMRRIRDVAVIFFISFSSGYNQRILQHFPGKCFRPVWLAVGSYSI